MATVAEDIIRVSTALDCDLTDDTRDAFADMLAKLKTSGAYPLSPKQRAWVDNVLMENGQGWACTPLAPKKPVPKGKPTPAIDKWLADKSHLAHPPPRPPRR